MNKTSGFALLVVLLTSLVIGGILIYHLNPGFFSPQTIHDTSTSTKKIINQGNQFVEDNLADTRDLRRRSDLEVIHKALFQYATENGRFPEIPETETCIGTSLECVNLNKSLVPNNIASIPTDPTNGTDENTGYFIYQQNRRIYLKAKGELKEEILIER